MEGQLVYVWRQPKVGDGRWTGPGIVVLDTAGGAWINMRGSLWRVSHEQMRGATQEESLGAELVNRYLSSLKMDLQKTRGARRYVDVSAEGPPRFPGDPVIEEDGDFDDMPDLGDSEEEPDQEAAAAATPLEASRQVSGVDTPTLAPAAPVDSGRAVSPAGTSAAASQTPLLDAAYGPIRSTTEQPVFPYPSPPQGIVHARNYYVEVNKTRRDDNDIFTADGGEIFYLHEAHNFYIRKKREADELDVSKLSCRAQKLFKDKGGSREKSGKRSPRQTRLSEVMAKMAPR